jgi:hypothetical protein
MSDNISVFEEYLFAADKREFLESCKNASQVKQYIRMCHLLAAGNKLEEKDAELLESWKYHSGDKRALVLKSELAKIAAEEDEAARRKLMVEFNSKYLGFAFNDSRQAAGSQAATVTQTGEKAALKTALTEADLKEMLTATKLDEVFASETGNLSFSLTDLGVSNLSAIDIARVKTWKIKEMLFGFLPRFAALENIVPVLVDYKDYMRSRDKNYYSWQLPEHLLNKLTLQQLDCLGDLNADTNGDFTFRKVQFAKRFNAELKALQDCTDVKQQRGLLHGLIAQIKTDTKRNNSGLLSALNEALLYNGYEQEEFDEAVFHAYLENPIIRHGQLIEDFRKRLYFQDSNWKGFVGYRPVNIALPSSDQLFEAYLNHIVTDEALIKKYGQYFNPHYLTGIVVTNRALAGRGMDEYKAHFGEHAADQFENKKNLEITWKNKRRFDHGEQVGLTLKVKNVTELTVKLFEIDTETYYKKNGAEVSDALDLDGLIPEKTLKFTYSYPKSQQHLEHFNFEDITSKDKGVFIFEFVGGGLSSRALIRKGVLKLLVQEHFQGSKLYVIDEHKQICAGPRTGLFLDGKFHKVNEKGYVLLPFNESVVNSRATLCHDGFCSLDNLYLPTENYSLRSGLIFNEESVVSGRKLRLVVKNRLMLNSAPITLKKLTEFHAEVQLTNYEGITNYKHFKDLTLSDAEDLVLELIVPPMLTRLTVTLRAKLKSLTGKDVELANAETVTITRDENSDRLMTCHLNHGPRGHYVEVKGKNGEAIPNQQVIVQLTKNFGNFNFTKELFTDASGQCQLGQLDDVRTVQVRSNSTQFVSRTFLLSNHAEKTSVALNYNICEGEQLVLPSMGLPLSRRHFELVEFTSGRSLLRSCFDQIAEEKASSQLVLDGLTPGQYEFTYVTNPPTSLSIAVHKAKRWEANPLFLELPHEIIEAKAEAQQLSVGNVQATGEALRFQVVSNSAANVRAHVFAYHHSSQLVNVLRERAARVAVALGVKSTAVPSFHNSFRSNRVLSDEHVYVNERKNKTPFVGNTLDKPSILLHREKVRETKDDEEVLQTGQDFAADRFMGKAAMASHASLRAGGAGAGMPPGAQLLNSYQIVSGLDFLSDSGRSFLNLKPSAEGEVRVPLADLAGFSHVLISVSDNTGSVLFDSALGQSVLTTSDLRVAKAKEQGLVYSEDFFARVAQAGQPVVLEDMANTSQYIVDDLASLLDVLLVIAGGSVNKAELQKFKFLVGWHKLGHEDKCKKFEEFGGHELNLFTYFRDRAFFDAHVAPMLHFKAKKETLDYLLLDDRVQFEGLLRPENFSSISMLEGALLVHRLRTSHPEVCAQYLDSIKKRQEVVRENNEKKKALFESILASKKIDEEKPVSEMKRMEKPSSS